MWRSLGNRRRSLRSLEKQRRRIVRELVDAIGKDRGGGTTRDCGC